MCVCAYRRDASCIVFANLLARRRYSLEDFFSLFTMVSIKEKMELAKKQIDPERKKLDICFDYFGQ